MTRKKGHTEEQIIAALQQAEAGAKTGELCRKLGVAKPRSTTGRSTMQAWAYRAARTAVTAGRERQAETNRGGLDARPADSAGDRFKKL